jgi:hypothetical protein
MSDKIDFFHLFTIGLVHICIVQKIEFTKKQYIMTTFFDLLIAFFFGTTTVESNNIRQADSTDQQITFAKDDGIGMGGTGGGYAGTTRP